MRMTELIETKKHRQALRKDEIRWMIDGFTTGAIPDYQMAAMAMAICFNGMDAAETAFLTDAMAHSGDQVDLTELGERTVDKHSTGGVGDKTTLIVGPLVAALGGRIAKMSGRGLGFTGGTIDKLEAIPGYRTELSPEAFRAQVQQIGIAVVSQSGHLAPADKKLYALRDVTATVDCMPLIASSIMSKKLASGARSIVLDVKTGSGAFMKSEADAERLARCMVDIGTCCGRRMCALITDMDAPLGYAVGNALEVREAAEILQGGGDSALREVCVALAVQMLRLSLGLTEAEAAAQAERALQSGVAFARMQEWVAAQGGDADVLIHPDRLPQAPIVQEVRAEHDGWLYRMDAQLVGETAGLLGTGRACAEDRVDAAAGLVLMAKPGIFIRRGDVLAQLHTSDTALLPAAEQRFRTSLQFADTEHTQRPPVLKILRQ